LALPLSIYYKKVTRSQNVNHDGRRLPGVVCRVAASSNQPFQRTRYLAAKLNVGRKKSGKLGLLLKATKLIIKIDNTCKNFYPHLLPIIIGDIE
ncbi:MAG: hypothetical protein ACTSQ8_25745, partial [Candidatus Helarchaeota archaeon]